MFGADDLEGCVSALGETRRCAALAGAHPSAVEGWIAAAMPVGPPAHLVYQFGNFLASFNANIQAAIGESMGYNYSWLWQASRGLPPS